MHRGLFNIFAVSVRREQGQSLITRHQVLPDFREEGQELLFIRRGIHAVHDRLNYVRVCLLQGQTELLAKATLGILAELVDDMLLVELEVIVKVRQVV